MILDDDLLSEYKDFFSRKSPFETNKSSYSVLSDLEKKILKSTYPIDLNEKDEIEIFNERGIWVNKQECLNWKSNLSLKDYPIFRDTNPVVINKKAEGNIEYIQEMAIRYLRPTTPPTPGEIFIIQEENIVPTPLPTLVIRQQPARPATPDPIIIREVPPAPPPHIPKKIIVVPGKKLPPPPRKVIIEKLPSLPEKPRPILVERWLPYNKVKRRIIFKKAEQDNTSEQDDDLTNFHTNFKDLREIRINLSDIAVEKRQDTDESDDTPDYVFDLKIPEDSDDEDADSVFDNSVEPKIDINSPKKLVKEDLDEFKLNQDQLDRTLSDQENELDQLFESIFYFLNDGKKDRISIENIYKGISKINSILNRSYNDYEIGRFFETLDVNNTGSISLNEFKQAFSNLNINK